MARKPNYGFEKRRKELERKQKQDAKLLRRQEEKQRAEEEARTPSEPVAEKEWRAWLARDRSGSALVTLAR